jgi:protein-S-isoprenylcysteine O-methyltransferase Ste14
MDFRIGRPISLRSFAFVFVQFACLGLMALTGPLFPSNPLLLLVELAGISLGLWAVFTIGIGKFHALPDPLQHSRLVTRGPFRLIRHPMYLGLLVMTAPLVAAEFTLLRLALWLGLLADLVLKLNYEEGLLAARLEGYKEYQGRSYRLIPFVY